MITNNIDSFLAFQEGWHKKYNGYQPSDLSKYFKDSEDNHQEIRSLIGGLYKTIEVVCPKSDQLDPNSYCKEINTINSILPSYFSSSKLSTSDILKPKISKVNKGIKNTKHIIKFAKKSQVTGKSAFKLLNIMSKINDDYSKLKDEEIKINVSIDTRQETFSILGKMGIDAGSCLSQSSFNGHHKYIACNYPNSFVILIHNNDLNVENFNSFENNRSITGRAFGFYHPEEDLFVVINGYANGIVNYYNFSTVIRSFFSKLNNKEYIYIDQEIKMSGDFNYYNRPAGYFATKDVKPRQYTFTKIP